MGTWVSTIICYGFLNVNEGEPLSPLNLEFLEVETYGSLESQLDDVLLGQIHEAVFS